MGSPKNKRSITCSWPSGQLHLAFEEVDVPAWAEAVPQVRRLRWGALELSRASSRSTQRRLTSGEGNSKESEGRLPAFPELPKGKGDYLLWQRETRCRISTFQDQRRRVGRTLGREGLRCFTFRAWQREDREPYRCEEAAL